MRIDSDLDAVRLRGVLRDLVALSAIPEAWVGKEPPAIAAGLVDVLVTSLRVDFAFVRLRDANGGAAVEIARGNASPALLDRLEPYIAEDAHLSRTEIVPGVGDGAQGGGGIVIPVGLNGERGLVAGACDRAGFPDDIDRLLLSVAANHAATAFRMARLVDDHRRAEAALRHSEQQLRKARDELETKVAERTAELRRSESYLAEAQRLSHIGTWAFNPTTTLYWSEENYRIWGLDPLLVLPTRETVWRGIHPDDRDRVYEGAEEALHQKRDYAVEFRILLPDGTVKYLEAISHPLFSASGELLEVVSTHVDVTERKRAQVENERLRQLEADLTHMNRLSMMGELAASLAHEVKQPIATARNNARAAMNFLDRRPPDLREVREALGCVVDDSDRAGDIIDRVRDQMTKGPRRMDRFDLNEAIDEVIGLARSAIIKNAVSVQTRLTEGLLPVAGDRVQLQQVVLNLILNAVEAMESVEAGARELLISTAQDQTNNGVLVAVRDSGPGIDPAHVERVFDAFYTTKSCGMGMGLSICRSIIDGHGGRLWAHVNEPRGAVFQFTLPSAETNS